MDTLPVCRICNCNEVINMDTKQPDELILPCKCLETTGLCHRSCLEEDRKTRNNDICVICNDSYTLEEKLPSFSVFLDSIRSFELQNNVCCFVVLVQFIWYNIYGAYLNSKECEEAFEKDVMAGLSCLNNTFWFCSIIIIFLTFLLVLLIRYTCRSIYFSFKVWQQKKKIWCVHNRLSLKQAKQYNPKKTRKLLNLKKEEDVICRICMSDEKPDENVFDELIRPCKCSGSIALCHRSCLNTWREMGRAEKCEICQFKYKMEEKQKGFFDYLREKGYKKRTTNERGVVKGRINPYATVIVSIIFTPFLVVAFIASVHGLKDAERDYLAALKYEKEHLRSSDFDVYADKLFFFVNVVWVIPFFTFAGIVDLIWRNWRDFKSWQATHKKRVVFDQLSREQSMKVNSKPKSDDTWLRRKLCCCSAKNREDVLDV